MELPKEAKDTRTLIRHVLPGLVFLVELVGICWLAGGVAFEDIVDAFKKESGLAVVVAAFLASGAIGYLLANIYHSILNTSWPRFREWCQHRPDWCLRLHRWCLGPFPWLGEWPTINYRPVLRYLTVLEKLQVEEIDGGIVTFAEPNLKRDWVILTALWHERLATNDQIKGATPRAESLMDTAHGAGTLLVASLIALPFGLLIAIFRHPSFQLPLALLGFILVFVHWLSFRWTISVAHNYVGTLLASEIRFESQKMGSPVLIYYVGGLTHIS